MWELTAADPGRWAALVLVNADSPPDPQAVRGLPVRTFWWTRDPRPDPGQVPAARREVGPDGGYTAVVHTHPDIRRQVYGDRALYDWLKTKRAAGR